MRFNGKAYVQPVLEWTGKSNRPPLRIGILVGSEEGFENWELQLFDRLFADPRFDLKAVLIHPGGYGQHRSTPLFDLVAKVDRLLFARQPAYRPSYFEDIHQRTEFIHLGEAGSGHTIGSPALEDLRLDLVLRTVPRGLPDAFVATLPYGEWALTFADLKSRTADWCSFAEVSAGAPTVQIGLNVNHGGGGPVEEIASAAFNPKFSAARNSAFLKEKAVILLMRELRRLADTGSLTSGHDTASARPAGPPGTAEVARYALGLARAAAARAAKELRRKAGMETAVWTLYSGAGSVEHFDPHLAVELSPTKDSIKADPFLFRHGEDVYVFYENYAVGDRKAHIAVGRLTNDGIEPLGPAIESASHLSFPFVFRNGKGIFMMPETHQEKRIEIWRCTDFPLKWELYATALEGYSAADSTLFRHKGTWWLLSNLSDHHAYEDHCGELHAFEVDGPTLSRVVPHARNPVVIGSTVARNAGRVFTRHGRLFRPSQNNAYGIYGYGLNIMEIQELSRETYRETCIRTIIPDFKPGLAGCHHFDAAGGRYILDARLSS
ncbi:glucosamine inositolphosphorylceramide transferase family protein [Chelativorans alearense]|uniref:glucosamine inositolphosphorylceramide transferase family protein n=1 Tax=Chelativorans alearense TaxID=2681495 RepID=UPI001FE5CB3F|nr:hypothetical protein [Chelativorans alearense]